MLLRKPLSARRLEGRFFCGAGGRQVSFPGSAKRENFGSSTRRAKIRFCHFSKVAKRARRGAADARVSPRDLRCLRPAAREGAAMRAKTIQILWHPEKACLIAAVPLSRRRTCVCVCRLSLSLR